MIINRENLTAISKGFKKVFDEALKNTDTEYEKIATVITAKSLTVDYAWLGDFPKMREWIGDRVLKDLKAHKYSITKKDFESTIEVTRDDIEYDNLGVVKVRIQGMAEAGQTHYDELCFPLFEENGTCYDGAAFFGDHDIGGVTFSNLGDKALTAENFNAYRSEMRGLVSDSGKPLRIVPNILMVPPELESTAKKIITQKTLANGEDNPNYNDAEILVADWLTDPTAWYLLDTKRVIKPIILQKNKDIKLTSMHGDNDENVFMRKSYRYGIDSQDNAGYGLWQLAYKSSGTV